MFSVAFLAFAAHVAAQSYGAPADDGKVVNDVNIKPKNLAEAYITTKDNSGKAAAIYYSTALEGEAAWKAPKVLYQKDDLVDPRGVKLCGPANADGQKQWLYVADAGNEEQGGYVYRYKIDRSGDAGQLDVEGQPEIVYGNGSPEYRPTDVSCDEQGNVFWNDEAADAIYWAKADVLEDGSACTSSKCGGAQFVWDCGHATSNLQSLEVAGNWVYWSQQVDQVDKWPKVETEAEDDAAAEEKEIAEANNGVWRVDISQGKGVQCEACKGAESKDKWPSQCAAGEEIEFFSRKDEGYNGLAQHNGNIYAVQHDNSKVYSLGQNAPNAAEVKESEFADVDTSGSYVASAGDRGLLVVDEIKGKGYVVNDKKEVNLAFELPEDVYAYGVAYGEGNELDEGDSAVSVAVSAFAGLVAIAALF